MFILEVYRVRINFCPSILQSYSYQTTRVARNGVLNFVRNSLWYKKPITEFFMKQLIFWSLVLNNAVNIASKIKNYTCRSGIIIFSKQLISLESYVLSSSKKPIEFIFLIKIDYSRVKKAISVRKVKRALWSVYYIKNVYEVY